MIRRSVVLFSSVAALALSSPAFASGTTYAQHLVDETLLYHPELTVLAMHATPPDSKVNVIVASNIGRTGKAADPDDLRVIDQGETNREYNADGKQYEVELPLLDASRNRIGALGVVFAYKKGDDVSLFDHEATQIRDSLARRISNSGNLVQPYRFDDKTPVDTKAQQVLDTLFAQHPDIIISAAHVTPPGQDKNVIVASTIGRIGKPADDDDMHVITSGETKLEIDPTGKRYEVELPLHNAAGAIIGAMGVVFDYNDTTDKGACEKEAIAFRDAFQAQLPTLADYVAPGVFPAAKVHSPLTIVGKTDLPGYTGDFDHFATDVKGNRLFMAAEDHGTLEVFNLKTGAHLKTIKGPIETPHSILYMPEVHKLLVTDSGKGFSQYFDSRTYKALGPLKLVVGADSVGYDEPRHRLYIVTGGKDVDMADSWLEEVDPRTGQKFARTHFDANHVEALAVAQHSNKLWINVTDKNYVAVLDKITGKVVTTWPINLAGQNCCFAYDEPNQRLFMATRAPGKLAVLNALTGEVLEVFDAPTHIDQVLWDAANRRVYALGGEGYTTIIEQRDADHYAQLPPLITSYGAKTGIIVPGSDEIYIAASPGDTGAMAAVLRISIAKR